MAPERRADPRRKGQSWRPPQAGRRLSMTNILVTGANGQVGWELQRSLAPIGKIAALDRGGMDLSDPDSIRRAIREAKPSIIVNAAGYTAVDKAESEPDLAMQVNG